MLSISVSCQVVSAVLNGFAATIWHLYLARFFYGITALSGTQVLVNRWFTKLRGTALGIVSSGSPIGTLILTPLSQYLILLWNWRVTMLFWAVVMLVVMVPLLFIIRNNPRDKGFAPDGEQLSDSNPTKFSAHNGDMSAKPEETGRTISETLKTRSFWLLSASQFFCGIGCGFIMTHIVIFATDMGFSDMVGATIMSVTGGFNLGGVLIMGYLSDKMLRKDTLALTHFMRSISFGIMILFVLMGGHSLWLLYLAMAFFGIGWFATAPLSAGVTADLYGNLRMGTILGLTLSCHMLGMAIGAYAGGAIYDHTKSYLLFFLIQCPLELVAVIAAFSIKQKRTKELAGSH
jgi:MFS family permease